MIRIGFNLPNKGTRSFESEFIPSKGDSIQVSGKRYRVVEVVYIVSPLEEQCDHKVRLILEQVIIPRT